MNSNQISPVDKQPQNIRLSLSQWLPITLVITLATVLCFYRINDEGLWIDELTSIKDAQEPVWRFSVRPLYYILLRLWMSFGSSDAWLRSLSVIFAIATTFLVYRLGRRLLGETEGLIAATLMPLSPLFINHAQEVRMYVLSTFMGVVSTLFLAKALTDKESEIPSHAALAGWSVFRLLAILTIPLNVTLLLPDVLIYGLRFRQQRAALIRFGGWLLLILLLWSPFALSVVQATSPDSAYVSHHPGRNPPKLDNIVRTLKFWTVWPFAIQANAIAANFYKVFTLIVAGLMGAALIQKHRSPQVLWATAWFAMPLLPILFFSYLSIPIWVNRYLLFVSPYLFLVLAAGLSRLWRQWRAAAIVIAIAYLIAASGGLMRYYTVQDRSDYKFIVETIEQYEQPQDLVVWGLFAQTMILDHYYQGSTEFYHNKTRGVSTDAEISAWLDDFPDVSERLWLVLKVDDRIYPDFEQQIKTRYVIEDAFDYEQGSKVLLLTNTKPNQG